MKQKKEMTIMTVLVKQKPGSHLKKLMQLLSSRVISLDLKEVAHGAVF